MFELNFSVFSLLLVIGFTVIVIGLISFTKSYFPALIQRYKPNHNLSRKWLYAIELFIFFTLLLVFISFLAERNSIVALMLAGVLLMAIYYLSTYFLKDYLSGLLIKSSGQYRIGDMVIAENAKGRISKLGRTQMKIKNADGQTIYVPYSWLRPRLKTVQQKSDKINGHSFNFKVETENLKPNTEEYLKNLIEQTPWVHPAFTTEVELLESNKDFKIFKITVYALSKSYHEKLENTLIRQF